MTLERAALRRTEKVMLRFRASSAGAVSSVRLFTRHHALHQPGDDREDRAAGTAADDLAEERPDIEAAGAAGRRGNRRNKGLQQLPASDAAAGAGDGVADAAEIVVLQRRAGGIATDDSRDELNDQIDDCFHGTSLSLAERRLRRGRGCHPTLVPLLRAGNTARDRDWRRSLSRSAQSRSCDRTDARFVRIDAPRSACSMGANQCCAEAWMKSTQDCNRPIMRRVQRRLRFAKAYCYCMSALRERQRSNAFALLALSSINE